MAFDRTAALRQAEKLIRQGKLEQAILEYTRVVDDQPRDWATANLLGDLLVRVGRLEDAVAQYSRCAETLRLLGFMPKAAALYKKILNLSPDDDYALVQAGEVAASRGLLVEARQFLSSAADGRRRRGDLAGHQQILARLETLATTGRLGGNLGPTAGQPAGDATAAGGDRDPALLLALAEMRLRTGDAAAGLALIEALVARHEPSALAAADLSARLAKDMHDDTGFQLADRVAAVCASKADWASAVRVVRRFLTARPSHVAGLERLADLSVQAGLADQEVEARTRIVDAHIAEGRLDVARALAQEFVQRHPDLPDQIDRLRRALVDAGAPDLEQTVAKPAVPPVADAVPGGTSSRVDTPPRASHAIDLTHILGNDERASSEAAAAEGDDEVDLSDMLEALPSISEKTLPIDADIEDVFRRLRQDVEGDMGPDAAEVAFQRGKALHDAGALDDCIEPLTLGARLPARRFTAAVLLAQVFQSRKQAADAIRWLGIAVDAPGIASPDRSRTMLELADLLERTGETSGALAVCLELHSEAGEYQDVSARIARLAPMQAGG